MTKILPTTQSLDTTSTLWMWGFVIAFVVGFYRGYTTTTWLPLAQGIIFSIGYIMAYFVASLVALFLAYLTMKTVIAFKRHS